MNSVQKHYCNDIKSSFPVFSKEEKQYYKQFVALIDEYSLTNSNVTYEDLIQKFGSPKEIVIGYINSQEENYLVKRIKTRKYLTYSIILALTLLTFVQLFKMTLIYDNYKKCRDETISEVIIGPAVEEFNIQE